MTQPTSRRRTRSCLELYLTHADAWPTMDRCAVCWYCCARRSCRLAGRWRRPAVPTHAVVRAIGRRRHPGDFRCGRWWFGRQDGRVGAHRAGWQPIGVGIPAKIGSKGMAAEPMTARWPRRWGSSPSTSPSAPQPNPGGGLQYVQVGPNHWWDGDMKSPTYNTMQVCKKAQCPFDTLRAAEPRTSTSRSTRTPW